jgi:hypothetical protein
MKMFCIVRKTSSDPDLDRTVTPYTGHVYIGEIAGFGGYIVSGTQAQLTAINALPNVCGLAYISDPKFNSWTELNDVINSTARTQLNVWLTKYSLSNIAADWTCQRVISMLIQLYKTSSPALTDVVSAAFRTQINTWLTARQINNIPVAWTYNQVCQIIDTRLSAHWKELDDVITPVIRTRLNTWLTAQGQTNIPVAWTNLQVVKAVYTQMRGNFELNQCDVLE